MTENNDDYPDNVIWRESPHGYYYNDGTPEKVRKLQAYMIERGFSPPIVICHNSNGCVYYTPKDASWTDIIIGAKLK